MTLSTWTNGSLQAKYINLVEELYEFKANNLDQIIQKFKCPPQIPYSSNPMVMINQAAFKFSVKSIKIKIVTDIVWCYQNMDRVIYWRTMTWMRLNNFSPQLMTVTEKKKSAEYKLPKLSKSRWLEMDEIFLSPSLPDNWACNYSLTYITRKDVVIENLSPVLIVNHPHSTKHRPIIEVQPPTISSQW